MGVALLAGKLGFCAKLVVWVSAWRGRTGLALFNLSVWDLKNITAI